MSSSASTDIDALFADVNAIQLTDIEADQVEGDGPVAAIAGAVLGAIVGVAAVVTNVVPYNPPSPSRDNAASRAAHAIGVITFYAGTGATMGALLPTP